MSKKTKSKTPKAPRAKMKQEQKIDCRHDFTKDEQITLSEDLTRKMTLRSELEEQMKSVASDYKARIKVISAEIGHVHGKLTSGYEMRPTDCIVHFNASWDGKKIIKKSGSKVIMRASPSAFVREEPMTHFDMQAELFEQKKLDAKEKKAKKTADAPKTKDDAPPLNPVDITTSGSSAARA